MDWDRSQRMNDSGVYRSYSSDALDNNAMVSVFESSTAINNERCHSGKKNVFLLEHLFQRVRPALLLACCTCSTFD